MALRQATCTSCQHSFRVTSSAAGEVQCPKCGGAVALADTAGARTASGRAGSAPRPSSGRSSHKHRSTSGAARAKTGGGKSLPFLIAGGALIVGLALWVFVSGGDDAPKPIAAAAAPAGIDLSKIPDLEPLEGTDPGDWEKMNEMMARYVKPPPGQTASQYGDRLMIKGRYSVPAILNGFKRIDLTTKDGAQVGWQVQAMLLQGLCKDTNFGWRRDTRPEDVAFNQEIVQRWFQAWKVAGDDDALWMEIAKDKGIPPGLEKPAPAGDKSEKAGM